MTYDNIEFDQGWGEMEKGIEKLKRILAGEKETPFTSREYMTLYTTIYNMCNQKAPHDYSEQLYDKYKETLDEYITSIILPSLKDKHDEFMLRELVERWLNHKIMFIIQRSVPALNEVGTTCFLNLVYEDVHPTIKDIVLSLIDKEREGEQIDRALLKNALDIFVEMGGGQMNRYQDDFEAPFLQETSNYFSRKASKWIEEASCPDYLLKSEECLKKEVDKVSNYLHSSTETKLIEKVQHELLVVYVNQLLEKEDSGIKVLFRDDKVDDLSRTYRVYNKISQGLDLVANVFKQHVTIEGTAFVQQAEEAASNQASNTPGGHEQVLVKNILELHDNYMTYLNSCFQNHNLFHKALKEAFEVFCNKNVYGSPSAEILASFADHILRKGGSEKLSDEVIEETLEKVVKLLQYVIDKDVFAEFYRKKLARRLLFDRGTNDDQERSILSKLKQQFGAPLTSKMEGMVTDVVLAKENQSSFQEYLRNNPDVHPGLDFTVTVLTTGFWPSYKSFDLSLPPEMVKCVEVFKGFYGTKTKHRKLTWIYSLGTSHINGKFEPKPIELIVSTHQAAVLLLFNASERLSYSEIVAQLNLAHDDLIRLLHSLSCAKYKILNKEPSSRSISQSDSFKFNPNFTDKMRRIKVPLPPVDERKKVIEDVDKDRPYAIDAAIVRIMKSRKVMTHQQLISETIEQLSRMFKPNIKSIKKRIEDLITRDYMERDRDNSHMFRYSIDNSIQFKFG
ncbi:hypothetical protein E1A91_A08G132600v1 [Gossypium mustelinum]|uniref:Cullin family profile domain-containing protein n=1 Tax=Gossypium mustelinum TaxID=34275 RepID=A0A5D2Y852_GOSMU|nr:hypothetical protein E1A91_A08G132600v1 [Gossypium mustelinum]